MFHFILVASATFHVLAHADITAEGVDDAFAAIQLGRRRHGAMSIELVILPQFQVFRSTSSTEHEQINGRSVLRNFVTLAAEADQGEVKHAQHSLVSVAGEEASSVMMISAAAAPFDKETKKRWTYSRRLLTGQVFCAWYFMTSIPVPSQDNPQTCSWNDMLALEEPYKRVNFMEPVPTKMRFPNEIPETLKSDKFTFFDAGTALTGRAADVVIKDTGSASGLNRNEPPKILCPQLVRFHEVPLEGVYAFLTGLTVRPPKTNPPPSLEQCVETMHGGLDVEKTDRLAGFLSILCLRLDGLIHKGSKGHVRWKEYRETMNLYFTNYLPYDGVHDLLPLKTVFDMLTRDEQEDIRSSFMYTASLTEREDPAADKMIAEDSDSHGPLSNLKGDRSIRKKIEDRICANSDICERDVFEGDRSYACHNWCVRKDLNDMLGSQLVSSFTNARLNLCKGWDILTYLFNVFGYRNSDFELLREQEDWIHEYSFTFTKRMYTHLEQPVVDRFSTSGMHNPIWIAKISSRPESCSL
mmetsp:Transcript_28926/g.65454  ORF Transcript_28926/g.65454 Transcript_28926/m.65454 type:complete len:526 (-) Transcript_28926:66-1643(-)|eukprot:CAMPEP_0197888090 /NCGR_PEP_ID=MMETSP1439-20131203/21033_1 /TAXON_ID=66791 /ORGANISM="Gonyaulax spinifera, Strain CCMP409" /LENGTH=525 /DNA_ID=CAMNT_0043507979 /DNA_START=62 /DNA_END=1639 /DNA_ORIENTATION=+